MAIARSSPYKRDPTPSFFPFHPRYLSLSLSFLPISVFLRLPFFFAYPFVSRFVPPSSFEALYIYSSFLFYFSPFPLSPSLFPLRRVNSRRIKLEEGGRFRGEFMGLGYRSRFQPLLNRDWYLWYTHDGTYHSPLPSVPYSSSIAHHMRVLGFSECFEGRNSPPQLPSPSLHTLVFRRTNVRDITRAHAIVKPKAINVNKGC